MLAALGSWARSRAARTSALAHRSAKRLGGPACRLSRRSRTALLGTQSSQHPRQVSHCRPARGETRPASHLPSQEPAPPARPLAVSPTNGPPPTRLPSAVSKSISTTFSPSSASQTLPGVAPPEPPTLLNGAFVRCADEPDPWACFPTKLAWTASSSLSSPAKTKTKVSRRFFS